MDVGVSLASVPLSKTCGCRVARKASPPASGIVVYLSPYITYKLPKVGKLKSVLYCFLCVKYDYLVLSLFKFASLVTTWKEESF